MSIEELTNIQIQELELLKENSKFSNEQIQQIENEIDILKERLKKKGN